MAWQLIRGISIKFSKHNAEMLILQLVAGPHTLLETSQNLVATPCEFPHFKLFAHSNLCPIFMMLHLAPDSICRWCVCSMFKSSTRISAPNIPPQHPHPASTWWLRRNPWCAVLSFYLPACARSLDWFSFYMTMAARMEHSPEWLILKNGKRNGYKNRYVNSKGKNIEDVSLWLRFSQDYGEINCFSKISIKACHLEVWTAVITSFPPQQRMHPVSKWYISRDFI